jgi:starvation-inducible DNA-binding protein
MNDYYKMEDTSSPKDALASQLAKLLGDTVNLSFLAQGAHWNVKGSDFYQMHEFFQEIYEDISSSVDPLAENILKMGYDAPYLLSDFSAFSSVMPVRVTTGDKIEFAQALYIANQEMLSCLNTGFSLADGANQQGVADFLAGRIDMHHKWEWQLRATLGVTFAPEVEVEEIAPYAENPIQY